MQPYPRSPDPFWPGHLHATCCLTARALDTWFPTVVWRLGSGLGFAVTLQLLAGVLGGCALVRCVRLSLVLGYQPAVPGPSFDVWFVFVCVLRPTPPLLTGVCSVCVCVCGLCVQLQAATPGGLLRVCACLCARSALPRQSWLGCALWVCGWHLRFSLCPDTPCCGVGLCRCICARSPVPRHSWLGCVVCVCVCVGSAFGCALPHLAGLLGCLLVCVRALPYRASPGWGVPCGCLGGG